MQKLLQIESSTSIGQESGIEKDADGEDKIKKNKYQDQSKFPSSSSPSSSSSSSPSSSPSSSSSSSSSSTTSSSSSVSDTNAPLYNTPEEHHIFLGTISKKEPPPIKITLSNFNPIKMPIFLESSDTPVCVCSGMSYAIGREDYLITKANIVDMLFYDTLITPSDTDEKCSCHSGQMQKSKNPKNPKSSIKDVDNQIEKLCHYFPPKNTKFEKDLNNGNGGGINNDDSDDDNEYYSESEPESESDSDSDDNDYHSGDDDNNEAEDDDDDDDEMSMDGEDDFYKSLNSYSYDDMNQIKLFELEKERKGRNQDNSCNDSGNRFCSSNEAKRADLKKLKFRLKKLILLRKKLIRRKKRVEEERQSAEENQNTTLIKIQNRIGGIYRDDVRDNSQSTSNLKIERQNMKLISQDIDAKDEIFSGKNSVLDDQKSLKSSQKKWNENLSKMSGRTGRVGRPLRSLGLVYECGQRAIGVARAGYNSFFHINLNLIDVPSKKTSSQSQSQSRFQSSSMSSPSTSSSAAIKTGEESHAESNYGTLQVRKTSYHRQFCLFIFY